MVGGLRNLCAATGKVLPAFACLAFPHNAKPWAGAQKRRQVVVQFPLTIVTDIVTNRKLTQEGASTGDGRLTGRVRSPRAKLVTSLPGGSGHRPGQHYDWSARCSLHWRRGGSSRLHPVIPGSAARG